MDLLARYEAGEHDAVWEHLRRLPALEGDFTEDARAVARATMTRVRKNAETLEDALGDLHFGFDAAPAEDASRALQVIGAPVSAAEIASWIGFRGVVPLSIHAFWEVVGHLNFIGGGGDEHFAWPAHEQLDGLQIYSPFAHVHPAPKAKAARPTPKSALEAMLDALLPGEDGEAEALGGEEGRAADEMDEEEDEEEIVITLDSCMKAMVGGVGAVVAKLGRTVDPQLTFEDERLRALDGRDATFVSYLRDAFALGGILGLTLERHGERQRALITRLTKDLIPF